jgi:hypothetical protein
MHHTTRKGITMATRTAPTSTAVRKAPAAKRPARKTVAPAASPSRAAVPAPAVAAPKAAVAPAKAEKSDKADKAKKPKLVRDSFTIPKAEYLVLTQLKQRAALAGAEAKKSELLRAGIQALARMDDAAFRAALAAVPTIKTGRPAKD